MGIYIKGIDIPANAPLLIKINPDSTVRSTAKNGYRKYEATPVPPHGRLIDAEEAVRYRERLVVDCDKLAKEYRYVVDVRYLDDLPTVIPADPAEKVGT